MNHLTAHLYEQDDGTLVIFRCPVCGSTGEEESLCRGHEPRTADPRWPGIQREPVRVPGAGEEPRLREALEEIVRIYNDDSLSNSAAQDRTDEVARAALDHFTQQPVGVGAGRVGRLSREARDVRDNPVISADSDGNQQPLGGDADARTPSDEGADGSHRADVAGGGSGQGAGSGSALAQPSGKLFEDIEVLEAAAAQVADECGEPFDGIGVTEWSRLLLALPKDWAFVNLAAQHPSGGQEADTGGNDSSTTGGQEGGVEEGADRG